MSDRIHLNTVLIHCEAVSKEAVLEELGSKLVEQGYVKKSYIEAVKLREKDFPTGLNVSGEIKVAIPHADSGHVNTAQIAFASLKNPVEFKSMENAEENIAVTLIFMLAVKEPEKQVVALQKLMAMFENREILKKLAECQSKNEAKQLLEKQMND